MRQSLSMPGGNKFKPNQPINNKAILSVFLAGALVLNALLPVLALPLSAGDRVRVMTPLDDELPPDSRFRISGLYEVNLDGTLQIPFIDPIPVVGLSLKQVEQRLGEALLSRGFFKPEFFQLSVKVAQWAPVQVAISGEVFQPGRVLLNAAAPETTRESPLPASRDEPVTIAGDAPQGRYLVAAIRQAGGVKPTADITQVRVIRGKQDKTFDLSGVFTGEPVPDVPLVAGDQIIVPAAKASQNSLVRPSQVTPINIPVNLSNLTRPNNDQRGGKILMVEYGTRLSQVVVAAGCAGGTSATNAPRRVVLVKTNRLTGETTVFNRRIERLLKDSNKEGENPFLMPQDSVVCYDSTVTNIASVLSLIAKIISPFYLIPRLFPSDD